jgi:outer membrane protein with beta-barrel domain
MTALRTSGLLLLVLGLEASPAMAQATAIAGRLEVAAGALWFGQASLGNDDAHETTSTGGAFRLFSSSTTVASIAGFEARVGYRFNRRLEVEGAVSFVMPDLRVTVSNDAESAAGATATERMQQFSFGGDVLWYLSERGRLAPFVEAGAGYLRLLHDERTLVATGRTFEAGGGIKYAFRAATAGVKAIGLRIDARGVARTNAGVFDDPRISPAAGASIYLRF